MTRALGGGYGFFLNVGGGVIDDVILYRRAEERFLLVCNASNRETVVAWLQGHLPSQGLTLEDITRETAMLALQGPLAPKALEALHVSSLSSQRPFALLEEQVAGLSAMVSRTGYTGEDGFELVVSAEGGPALWQGLAAQGAAPCGLGARDILRLEAAFPLHGNELDPTTTPLEAGLERFVALGKGDFVGREALLRQQEKGVSQKLVGFRLLEGGIPRKGYRLMAGEREIGRVTSGGYSPALDGAIGLGYLAPEHSSPGTRLAVDIRGRAVPAEVVPLPFYRRPS
jgi:aminomethyltransferase